jgi:hypothetical protein
VGAEVRTRLIAVALVVGLAGADAAGAPTDSPARLVTQHDQRDVAVTIYSGDLGFVRDVREVSLPAGNSVVQFADVAARLDPSSIDLRSLTDAAGLGIVERSYEYDLVSNQKLLEKYVGQKVGLYQPSGSYVEATLLSAAGPIYEINGQIHLGQPGHVVLPELPEHLVLKPTLVWLLRNRTPGLHRIQASYLTQGLTWKADYAVVLSATDDRADLSAWVTIDNRSGAAYRDAALRLVAGDVHRARPRPEPRQALQMEARGVAPEAGPAFTREDVFEYHVYALDRRTTIKDNQTKQLSLLAASGVPVAKEFVYYGAPEQYRVGVGAPPGRQRVSVLIELANSKENGLGVPLPGGTVRVYKTDRSGGREFIGEDRIDHAPRDERVKVNVGQAFDVVAERVQKDWRAISPGLSEVEWEISFRNRRDEDLTVTVMEPVPGDWEALRATHPHDKADAHTLRFRIPVPKAGAARLGYRVRVKF